MSAQRVIAQTVDTILALKRPHPLRIGIDGASASGKTTFADQLVKPLQENGRPVIRASIDGFHNPPETRYRKGKHCPIGYVEDSFDKQAVVDSLLQPLGPNGQGRYRKSLYDFTREQETQVPVLDAASDTVLVFEGVMLFCDTLAGHFDYRIFVHTDFETVIERALKRDSKRLGGNESTLGKYRRRYIPGQEEYFKRHSPRERAHLVIDNNDFRHPKILGKAKT